jgi:dienelactone hydrolase
MKNVAHFKAFIFLLASFSLLISDITFAYGDTTEILNHGLFLHAYFSRLGTYDPLMEKIVHGRSVSAYKGETVKFPNGKVETWTEENADTIGWFRGKFVESSYGYFKINSKEERIVLLEAMGDQLVYVNGVPRVGNAYGYKDTWEKWEPKFDFSFIPIKLRKGENELLFLCTRGYLKVVIHDVGSRVLFNKRDVTLPDLLLNKQIDNYASIVVINATNHPLKDAYISVYNGSGVDAESKISEIQPMSVRKVAFRLLGKAPRTIGKLNLSLKLYSKTTGVPVMLDSAVIQADVVTSSQTRNITFLSDEDGSVQYFALVPPLNLSDTLPKALFLSLHGADVIATNMANSYYPKEWGYIVCPTNRRPYGFDWEDWGRLDALQVLRIAESSLNIDPARVYLTGHSMGGHGTWVLGGQYPDKFAAIGPSAGWISWWTYVFHADSALSKMERMMIRTGMENNPFKLVTNYKQFGIYALHGSADDNVPVEESIRMIDTLKRFDHDFIFHEEPGVGHWWSKSQSKGTDCVDWPEMFDYFARHARPNERMIRKIDFTTLNPGVSSKDLWLTIYGQEKQLEATRVEVQFDPSLNQFEGRTENASLISFDTGIIDRNKPVKIVLDSTKLVNVEIPSVSKAIWLKKVDGQWHEISEPSLAEKNPKRYGTFRDAFRNKMVFVYGTHGTKQENEWAFDKARYDAEYFWYQGNGSVDIVSDNDFDVNMYIDRNVILYGNEKTNSAWDKVLDNKDVLVSEGRALLGNKVFKGRDYACFMVRPKKGSLNASVGIVSGTGVEGMRLTYVMPYLQPGFSLPDVTVFNSAILSKGYGGVEMAGFFGTDWSVKEGEFVTQ